MEKYSLFLEFVLHKKEALEGHLLCRLAPSMWPGTRTSRCRDCTGICWHTGIAESSWGRTGLTCIRCCICLRSSQVGRGTSRWLGHRELLRSHTDAGSSLQTTRCHSLCHSGYPDNPKDKCTALSRHRSLLHFYRRMHEDSLARKIQGGTCARRSVRNTLRGTGSTP